MSKRAVRGLDHVVVMVDGIDAAQRQYEKLGFQVQPRGFHRKLGTANHLMIFDTDYFEIVEGLSEGQEIITGGYKAISKDLEDGKKVKFDGAAAAEKKVIGER